MLTKVSEDAADCLRHAAACESQAKLAADPTAKQSFVDLAGRWRRMAETLDYIERVDRFLSKPEARGAAVGGAPREANLVKPLIR